MYSESQFSFEYTPELSFDYTPAIVEGSESDGETMLFMGREFEYEYPEASDDETSAPVINVEYEYPENDKDNYNGFCNGSIISETDNAECLSYPVKRKQRRAKLNCVHCYVAQTGAVAVAASASMIAEEARIGNSSATSMVAANTAILACVIGGIVAILSKPISGLACAIRTPQRDEELEDAPSGRLWFRISCGLLCIASLVKFGSSFCVDPIEPLSAAISMIADQHLLRVLCVIAVSLISGGLLGLKHPLQSALLLAL